MDIKTVEFYKSLAQVRASLSLLANGDELSDGALDGEVLGFPGLIYVTTAVSPQLNIAVGPWDDMSTDPTAPDNLKVYISTSSNIDPDVQAPFATLDVTSPPDTISVNVPLSLRPEGIYWLMYEVFVAATFNSSRSIPQPLIIDRTAPYTGYRGAIPAPVRPTNMPATVTKDWFDSQPGGVALFTIPDYAAFGLAPGDWILVYMNGSRIPIQLAPVDPANPADPPEAWVLGADLSFPITWDAISSLLPPGGGPVSFYYELFDAAGNPARPSATSIPVTFSNLPEPTLMLPPGIDRAVPGDNLVDRNDTALDSGMIVRIPEYSNFVRGPTGDSIVVTLQVGANTVTLPAVPLGTSTFPVGIPVSLAQLLSVYNVAQGPVPMQVSYLIQRDTNTFPLPPTPAPSTTLNLDLFFPTGPAATDAPSLVNRNLIPVDVFGRNADGSFGPVANQLTRLHANRPAQARVTLWNTPPLPGVSNFSIKLFYAGQLVATVPVTGGVAGQIVNIDIPWSLIQAQANGNKDVFYSVGATGTNEQLSVVTVVNVQSNFKFLAAPQVRRLAGVTATNPGAVNCDSFLPKAPPGVITVFVPPSAFFGAGEIINVFIEGYSDNAGTIPVPGATASVSTAPYDAVAFRNGVEVTFPGISSLLELVQPDSSRRSIGSLRVFYSTRLVPEGVTKSDEATPAARGIRVGTGGYFYCSGTAAPLP